MTDPDVELARKINDIVLGIHNTTPSMMARVAEQITSLVKAYRLEGIKLGLEAGAKRCIHWNKNVIAEEIFNLSPEKILKGQK